MEASPEAAPAVDAGPCATTDAGVVETRCAGECVDLSSDPGNCGACGNACAAAAPSTAACTAGRCLITLASRQNQPCGITVDQAHVYFTNCGTQANNFTDGTVVAVPLGGGALTTLASGQNTPGAITVDSTSAYYVGGGLVMKVALEGGTPVTLGVGGNPIGVAVDPTSVYWTDGVDGTVVKAPIDGVPDGGSPLTLASGENQPIGIAVDGTSVYWAVSEETTVMSVPLDGGTLVTLASGQGVPYGVALNATNVYWTEASSGAVATLPLHGAPDGGTPTTLASGLNTPSSIALDTASVYFTDATSVSKVPITGGAPVTIAAGISNGVAVDATSVYWVTDLDGVGSVFKLTPK